VEFSGETFAAVLVGDLGLKFHVPEGAADEAVISPLRWNLPEMGRPSPISVDCELFGGDVGNLSYGED